MPISRWRADARPSSKFATLVQTIFLECDNVRLHACIGIGIKFRKTLRDTIQFALGLRKRNILLEPRGDDQIVAPMIGEVLGSQGDGDPELVVGIREMKTRRHDADDGIALTIEQDCFVQNLRIRAKAALP